MFVESGRHVLRTTVKNRNHHGEVDSIEYPYQSLSTSLARKHLYLNLHSATLTSPFLRPCSQFHNIFDLDHFKKALAPDIPVVLEAPAGGWSPAEEKDHSLVVPKYSPPEFYLEHGAPLLKQYGVLKLAGYMHGLGFQGVPHELQRLRCRANYEALRLAPGLQVRRLPLRSGFCALHSSLNQCKTKP